MLLGLGPPLLLFGVAVPLPPGRTGEATAPAPGKYDFVCTIHPAMTGTIIVT